VALLHALHELRNEWAAFEVAYLQHGIRAEAKADARFVMDYLRLGLVFHLKKLTPELRSRAGRGNLEALCGAALPIFRGVGTTPGA
jgi:tRNA(Ile)-lysidine synthase TilS/MesJ